VIAAVVGVPLFALIDAARLAHRGVGPGARWYVCVLAIVAVWVALVLVGALAAAARPSFPWQSFNIPSASMAPTLRVGDMVLADKTYYATHAPERGDIAMYLLPTDNSTIYVKRIVGLPGDRIAFRDGHVVLNGAVTAEPFADFGDPKAYYNTTSEVVVPPDHLFVAGDNRANSSDSRSKQHGFVPLKNLTDRATVIIYSHDSRRRGLWVGSPI
jgi:signal peptidase I